MLKATWKTPLVASSKTLLSGYPYFDDINHEPKSLFEMLIRGFRHGEQVPKQTMR
jgi:hypothetical protein